MIVGRLGDGDPALSPSLGGGPLGADVFDFSAGLWALLREGRPAATPPLLGGQESVKAIVLPTVVYPGTPGGGDGNDNGASGDPGSDSPGDDGDSAAGE